MNIQIFGKSKCFDTKKAEMEAKLQDEKLAKALGFKIENGKKMLNLAGYFTGGLCEGEKEDK